jgi:hypothetical protein
VTQEQSHSRLDLVPADESVGDVGGVWWPHSRDLTAELPQLVADLAGRLGRVERILYDPSGWAEAPEQIVVGDATITLEAYTHESFNKLYAYGADGTSIVLQVTTAATDDATESPGLTPPAE